MQKKILPRNNIKIGLATPRFTGSLDLSPNLSRTYILILVFINFTSSKSDMELITRRIIEKFEGDANKNLEKYATTGSPEYQKMVDEIASQLGLTSLKFNTIEQLVEAIGLPKCQVCTHCFDGSSAYTLNEFADED